MKYVKILSAICLVIQISEPAFAKPKGFIGNIDKLTIENKNFRKVLYTSKYVQLVLMTLKPGEDIGEEIHQDIDQFFRFEGGSGKVVINSRETNVKEDDAVLIPAGARHNVVNTGKKPLQFYTLYSPPEHKDKTIHATKAEQKEEHFDGKTSE